MGEPVQLAWRQRLSGLAVAAAAGMAFGGAPRAAALPGLLASTTDKAPESPASTVVVVRDKQRMVMTVAATYNGTGDVVMLLPVPVRGADQALNIAEVGLVERLDAVSAPRFLELVDPDPCHPLPAAVPGDGAAPREDARPAVRSVLSDGPFDAGDPTVAWLSAKDAANPLQWLKRQGYRLPPGAAAALKPYVARHQAFVAARYRLPPGKGPWHLRPVQVALEVPDVTLALALGRVNARGQQQVHLFALTRDGRQESRSPPVKSVPAGAELPPAVLRAPQSFYAAMSARLTRGGAAALLEYAWDASWCEPCAASPLTAPELRRLGVFWLDRSAAAPSPGRQPEAGAGRSAAEPDVFMTRLLLHAGPRGVQEDVTLEATGNRNDVQARFVARVPFAGEAACVAGDAYRKNLAARREAEAQTLARLAGWDMATVRRSLDLRTPPAPTGTWVDDLWKD